MNARKPRILVVEDDLKIVQSLISGLSREGFDVTIAMDGDEGAAQVLGHPFDVVVLDLMLPGRDGFSILEAMSGRVSTPVVVLSARTELDARVRSFTLGAVDYVPKPFWMEELVLRIRSRLNLTEETPRRVIEIGDVVLDLDRRSALRGDADLGLTAHEFNILHWLAARPQRAVSRQQLADNTLPEDGERTPRTVDSHVSRIRKKLGEEGKRIKTVWGIGYRYQPEAV
ncbi:MAG: response regulator transcription factor [Myxococcota bacterium]